MIIVIVFNLLLALVGVMLPNDVLMHHSYILFSLQLATLLPSLLKKTRYLHDIFIPSYFVLIYFVVNLAAGSYLVPRDYGWNKWFTESLPDVSHFQLIIPYFILANVILFAVTHSTLEKLVELRKHVVQVHGNSKQPFYWTIAKVLFYFLLFFLVTYAEITWAFPIQIAVMILHLTDSGIRQKPQRYLLYTYYLAVMLMFGFDSKREIAMALFLVVFLEGYYKRIQLSFSPVSLLSYVLVFGVFVSLVLTASILRGYGGFPVNSMLDALYFVPQYITSDMFLDGVTDNLELNYNFGSAVTSVDYVLSGRLSYQLGLSLLKVFFLPIPRTIFASKPEGVMQIFTKEYYPSWWEEGGSLPVVFSSEMFVNFHYFGLVVFCGVWLLANSLFIKLHNCRPNSIAFYSCLFLVISVLAFARGSGLELYVFYYLMSLPLFFSATALRRISQRGLPGFQFAGSR